jgi:hypothetical protein
MGLVPSCLEKQDECQEHEYADAVMNICLSSKLAKGWILLTDFIKSG